MCTHRSCSAPTTRRGPGAAASSSLMGRSRSCRVRERCSMRNSCSRGSKPTASAQPPRACFVRVKIGCAWRAPRSASPCPQFPRRCSSKPLTLLPELVGTSFRGNPDERCIFGPACSAPKPAIYCAIPRAFASWSSPIRSKCTFPGRCEWRSSATMSGRLRAASAPPKLRRTTRRRCAPRAQPARADSRWHCGSTRASSASFRSSQE